MFARARVLFSGPRVWCPLVFIRSPSSGAGRTSGRASPLGHAWEATLGTNKRLHTQALVRTSDGKPRDSDDEADNEGSKLSKLDAEQWEKIAAAYVHRDAPRAAGEASSTAAVHGAEQVSNPATVHGAEPEGRKDYDLEKLLANISVLKSAEQIQEEARKAERPRRTSAMSIAELVDFLRDENALDICVINVPPEKQYVKYFVTCSGKGLRHLSKIAHSLVDEVSTVLLWVRSHHVSHPGEGRGS